jgi:ubiquinone/menaquinone biosynthesis C-methylase UbiE
LLKVEDFWARVLEPSGQPGPNYWEYFAERLAQLAAIQEGQTILDLGTYDGNVLFKALQRMNGLGYGVGGDIYYGGFQDGVADALKRGWEDRVSFVQTDANALGFGSELFDTVLANFIGWDDVFDFERMVFICPDTMMAEIYRVLKPGGQVGFGGWVEQRDLDWIVHEFETHFPSYDENFTCYGTENPEGQQIILQSAGFEDVRVHQEKAEFVSTDAEIWWRQMRQAVQAYFKQIPDPDTLKSFKERVFTNLQAFQSPQGVRFSKAVSFAFGTKPK